MYVKNFRKRRIGIAFLRGFKLSRRIKRHHYRFGKRYSRSYGFDIMRRGPARFWYRYKR